ncbi:MAG: pyridoxamine 5'-phosphate oxidase family protein [Candidatus Omnitrophica bacterium]|nr:pyridoxamine 5'-phosphate oxidase family protein [Candidatus Omnitrophota bacterium]
MKDLPEEIVKFFNEQGFVIVSTLDPENTIHSSAKGIVGISKEGRICVIDIYMGKTWDNIKNNPVMTITAIDEYRFIGYALKGKALIVNKEDIKEHVSRNWEKKVTDRISKRVVENVKKQKSSLIQPEAKFPKPQYLIQMIVDEIVNLTPNELRKPHK